MNSKQKKTIAAIFAKEIPRNLAFRDIESLLKALGCEVREAAGSRILFTRDGLDWPVHRPHPGNEAKPYQIKELKDFLTALEGKQ